MRNLDEYYDLLIRCKYGERKCIEKDFKQKSIMDLLKVIGKKTQKELLHIYETNISKELLDALMLFATNKPLPNLEWKLLEAVLMETHVMKKVVLKKFEVGLILDEMEHFLSGLMTWLAAPFLKDLTSENCISVWKFMMFLFPNDVAMEVKILSDVEKLLMTGIRKMVVDPAFYRLSFNELRSLLDRDGLKISFEAEILDVITHWIDALPDEREKYATELISTARRGSIPKHLKEFRNLNIAGLKLSEKLPRNTQETVMMIGGWSATGATNKIEIFDYINNEWLQFPIEMPYRSAYHGSVLVNGELYIIGGIDNVASTAGFSSLIKLDKNMEWKILASMAERRFYITNACVELNGYIYAFGGFNGVSPERHRTAERYSIETDKWHYLTPMPFPRSDAAAAVANGRIFVVGGYAGSGVESIGQPLLAMVDMFDPLTGGWTSLQTLPEPRAGHSLLVCNNSLLVVGGWDGNTVKNTVYAARASNPRRWEESRNMSSERKCFTSTVVNGGIYVAGGHNGETIIKDAEFFDGSSWKRVAPLAYARSATTMIALNPAKSMEFIRKAQEYAEKMKEFDDLKTESIFEKAPLNPEEPKV